MNKLFIRLLIGLVCVISGLGLFNYVIISIGQKVWAEHCWATFTKPVLSYISKDDHVLEQLLSDPAYGLSRVEAVSTLESVTQARLAVGQVVPDIDDRHVSLLFQTPQGEVLKSEFDPSGAEFYRTLFKVIGSELSYQIALGNDFAEASEYFAALFDLNLIAIEQGADALDGHDFDRLVEADRLGDSNVHRYDSILVRFSDDLALWVEMPDGTNRVSAWFSILLLIAMNVLVLAQMTRIPLSALDRQLRSVENVVGRIARGELDARVTKAQSGEAIGR